MNRISIARVKELLTYDPETGVFRWRVSRKGHTKAGNRAGYSCTSGRRQICLDGVLYQAGHLAWLLSHEQWPHPTIDHKNRDPSDDRLLNLRVATKRQQVGNMRQKKPERGLPKGVQSYKDRFTAKIRIAGKQQYLGIFQTAEAAHAAYCRAARETFGEFACGG